MAANTPPDAPPPDYQEACNRATSGGATSSVPLTLVHYEPGPVKTIRGTRTMTFGDVIEEVLTAIAIESNSTYAAVENLLYERFEAHCGIDIESLPHKDQWTGLEVLRNGRVFEVVDEQSWHGCLSWVLNGSAELSFWFAGDQDLKQGVKANESDGRLGRWQAWMGGSCVLQ